MSEPQVRHFPPQTGKPSVNAYNEKSKQDERDGDGFSEERRLLEALLQVAPSLEPGRRSRYPIPLVVNQKRGQVCPLCNGREGRTVVADSGHRSWVPCECRERRLLRLKAQNAGIPSEFLDLKLPLSSDIAAFAYLDVSVDKAVQIDINQFLTQYVENLEQHMRDRRSLLLFGNNGSGKTSSSMFIALNAIRKGKSVKYITLRRFLNQKHNYSDPDAIEEAEYVRDVDVLVLDDIGKEFHGGSALRALVEMEELLRYRFSRDGITILTSNFNPFADEFEGDGVARVHHESILSLMMAHCLPVAVIITEDYRRELARRLWDGLDITSMEVY